MTLDPLLQAPMAVQFHVATVLPAALIGAFLLIWRGKGTRLHRGLGRLWMVLMITTALSTFFIHEINLWRGFSPIHLLSIVTIAGCWSAYRLARQGNIRGHRIAVLQVYIGGIVIAGGFTLLPHRIMNRVVFENSSAAGLIVLCVVLVLPWLILHLAQRRVGRAIASGRRRASIGPGTDQVS